MPPAKVLDAAASRKDEDTTGERSGGARSIAARFSSRTANKSECDDCGVSEKGSGGLLVVKLSDAESLPEMDADPPLAP